MTFHFFRRMIMLSSGRLFALLPSAVEIWCEWKNSLSEDLYTENCTFTVNLWINLTFFTHLWSNFKFTTPMFSDYAHTRRSIILNAWIRERKTQNKRMKWHFLSKTWSFMVRPISKTLEYRTVRYIPQHLPQKADKWLSKYNTFFVKRLPQRQTK